MAKFTDTRLNALANNTKSSSSKSSGDFAADSKSNKSSSKKSSGIANAVSNLVSSSKSNGSGSSSTISSPKNLKTKIQENIKNEAAKDEANYASAPSFIQALFPALARNYESLPEGVEDTAEAVSKSSFDSTYGLNQIFGTGSQSDVDEGSKKLPESEWIDNSDKASSFADTLLSVNRDEDGNYSPIGILNGLVSNSGVGYTSTDPNLVSFIDDGSELSDYQKEKIDEINSASNTGNSSEENSEDSDTATTSSDEVSFKDAVQKIMRSYTGNDDWDFYTDYADLAENGDADTWRQIYQSPELMQGYIDQYGLDTDGDGTISDDEANAWYNKMKEENVSDLNFTNDDEITSRIFGNTGEGSNNDIVDALLNSLSAQLIESDNSDDQTYYNLVNLFTPYYEDDEGNVEAGVTDLQRLNNAVKLSYILEAMDNGNNNSIDMGDNDEDVANYMNSLLANINGGDAGNTFSLEDLKGQDAGNGASYYANTSSPASSGAEEFENMINNGSTQASDALLSYLLNATNSRNENNDSLKDAGYYSWLKSALASTEE